MGLSFKKSISIISRIKLSFRKTGMSVSTGVHEFRTNFHTSGRVITRGGISGKRLYKKAKLHNTRNQLNRISAHN